MLPDQKESLTCLVNVQYQNTKFYIHFCYCICLIKSYTQGLVLMILQIFALKIFLILNNYHFFSYIKGSRNGHLQNIIMKGLVTKKIIPCVKFFLKIQINIFQKSQYLMLLICCGDQQKQDLLTILQPYYLTKLIEISYLKLNQPTTTILDLRLFIFNKFNFRQICILFYFEDLLGKIYFLWIE